MTPEYVMVPREASPEMVAQAMKECAGMGAGSCGEHAGVDGDDMRAVWDAMVQAAPPAPAPISDEQLDELHGAMSDEQMTALARLRGGCSCHISPPCNACVEPLTEKEAISLGLLPDEPPPAPVAHSKSEYKRRVAMGDASILPPAPVPVQPAPVAAPVVTDAQIDERAAFTKWASDQGFLLIRLDIGAGEDYHDVRTQAVWEAWQARAILAAQSGAGTRGEGNG